MNKEKLVKKIKAYPYKALCKEAILPQELENIRQGIGYYDGFKKVDVRKLNNTPRIGYIDDSHLFRINKHPKVVLDLFRFVCDENTPIRTRIQKIKEEPYQSTVKAITYGIIGRILCAHNPQEYIPWTNILINFLIREADLEKKSNYVDYNYVNACSELKKVAEALGLNNLAELYYLVYEIEVNNMKPIAPKNT